MTGYSETIRKWAADDRYTGRLKSPDGIGEVGLEAGEAGRKLAVRFTLRRRGDLIEQVRYQVFGCGFTIAACAAAAELAEGATLDTAREIDRGQIDRTLDGLPDERGYCADIAVKAFQAAVSSLDQNGHIVQSDYRSEEHGPRISENSSVFRLLMESPNRNNLPEEDRRMFAGAIALAAEEPCVLYRSLGLEKDQLGRLLANYFPTVSLDNLLYLSAPATRLPPKVNTDVMNILRSFVPRNPGGITNPAAWLADILAARTAQPGHLWVAMGFFERSELTAAISRHLPTLAAANDRNMRWKRFLFKQVCDINNGVMCKSPNCGECSDYAMCFENEA